MPDQISERTPQLDTFDEAVRLSMQRENKIVHRYYLRRRQEFENFFREIGFDRTIYLLQAEAMKRYSKRSV